MVFNGMPKLKWIGMTTWNHISTPRSSFCASITCFNRLTVKSRLSKQHLASSAACEICDLHDETWEHVFMECANTKMILVTMVKVG